jgi:hypothetical protein
MPCCRVHVCVRVCVRVRACVRVCVCVRARDGTCARAHVCLCVHGIITPNSAGLATAPQHHTSVHSGCRSVLTHAYGAALVYSSKGTCAPGRARGGVEHLCCAADACITLHQYEPNPRVALWTYGAAACCCMPSRFAVPFAVVNLFCYRSRDCQLLVAHWSVVPKLFLTVAPQLPLLSDPVPSVLLRQTRCVLL